MPLGGLVVIAQAREVLGGREIDTGIPPPPGAPPPPPPGPGALPPPPPPAAAVVGAGGYVHQGLRPDIAYWVTPDDQIQVGVRNSQAGVTLAAAARLWIPGSAGGFDPNAAWPTSSPISSQFLEGYAGSSSSITPSTDRSLGLTTFQLAQGYLTGVAVRATAGAPLRGQCLVSLYLVRGVTGAFTTFQLLGQDYVTAQQGVGWPYGRIVSGVEGPGKLSTVLGAQPPAGADINLVVPTGARWRVRFFGGHFVTSAAATNRIPQVAVVVSGTRSRILGAINQGATAAVDYQWQSGFIATQVAGAPDIEWMPPEVLLGPGDAIQTFTVGLDVADQWSGVYAYVEEVIQD